MRRQYTTLSLTLLLLLQFPVPAVSSGKGVFMFGGNNDKIENFKRTWLNLDSVASLRFNEFSAPATRDTNSVYWPVDTWESRGIHVRAENQLDGNLLPDEQGYIFQTMYNAGLRKAVYSIWQAEDTTRFGTWGIAHATGEGTSVGWVGDDTQGHQAGMFQTGPAIPTGAGSMINVELFTVQYRMRFDTTSSLSDTTAICRITGTHDGGTCADLSPFYDSTLRVADLKEGGLLGVWRTIELRDVHMVKFEYEIDSCTDFSYHTPGPNFNLEWYGKGRLELDWTRCLNTNGYDLALSEDPQFRQDIKTEAGNFKDDSVWTWFGGESGHYYPDMIDGIRFVDSLVDTATEHHAFAHVDMNLFDLAAADKHFNFHMYRMLKYGNMKHLFPWYQPFDEDNDSAHNVDYINRVWYDTLTNRMNKWIMPWVDTVPGFRVVPYVQVWSNSAGMADVSPTANDVVCLVFMWLAHGAKGIHLYRYDGGVWSDGSNGFGLIFNSPYPSGPIFYSPRYFAIRNRVSPLLMDSLAGWGDLLFNLDWRGVGRADTLVGNSAAWNLIKSFSSSVVTPAVPYVEAGFFRDSTLPNDYIMLINRRTPDDTAQHVTVGLDVTKLASPGQTHYYIIDLNPQDTLVGADTILAGPISNEIAFSASIRPGGVKFYKITPAPDRIYGTAFPAKWWGEIHAGNSLTLSSGRELRLQAPLTFKMHLDSGSLLGFNVQGKLTAIGTSGSPILFTRVKSGDNGIWGGLNFSGTSPACTLQYCDFEYSKPAMTTSRNLVLDHVTTTNSTDTVCILQPGLGSGDITMNYCALDGTILVKGGKLRMDYCTIDSARIGIEVRAAGFWNDSAVVKHTKITNSDSIAVLASGYPVRMQQCTLSVADIGIASKATALHVDSVYVNGCGQGVLIDTNATVGGKGLHTNNCPIGMNFRRGWGSLDSSYVISTDSGVVADPGIGHAITFTRLGVVGSEAKKGVAARSGEISLINSQIYANSLTGLESYYGTATVRLDTVDVAASPASSAAVSIGPGARLVAKKCNIHDSWIGIELRTNGADTIAGCRLTNNTLYGIWCDSGTTTDLLSGNRIENTAATASNFGINVLLQPILSVNDTIMGGYNWNFNFNSGHKADVRDLVARGKSGDDWGLVFNGPLAQNDSAFAIRADVRDRYDGAHLYLRYLYASIKESHFVSTGDSTTSSPYGVKDMGSTSGLVRCTEVAKMKTDLVYRGAGSTISWGSSADQGKNNIFSPALSSTKLFRNTTTTTAPAEYNWWGSNPPDSSRFVGPVDYTPYQTDSTNCQSNPDAKVAASAVLPLSFALEQNHPNPFNPLTTIQFSIPIEQDVKLDIFNILGQRVRVFNLGNTPAGYHEVVWDGTSDGGIGTGSGMYFYRLNTPKFTDTKKMLLLK